MSPAGAKGKLMTCAGFVITKKKGRESMALLKENRQKQEKINGVVYDMSPSPDYTHGIVNNNINTIIKNGLKDSLCLVFMENLDFKCHPEVNDDYVIPDVMVICDRKHLKGGSYSGVPKFTAETLSPSTALRDKTEKKEIYEKAGVEEYWIVSPNGELDIYYLENGTYTLAHSYFLQDDPEEEHYNAKTEIRLKTFPHIKMELGDIFEGII